MCANMLRLQRGTPMNSPPSNGRQRTDPPPTPPLHLLCCSPPPRGPISSRQGVRGGLRQPRGRVRRQPGHHRRRPLPHRVPRLPPPPPRRRPHGPPHTPPTVGVGMVRLTARESSGTYHHSLVLCIFYLVFSVPECDIFGSDFFLVSFQLRSDPFPRFAR